MDQLIFALIGWFFVVAIISLGLLFLLIWLLRAATNRYINWRESKSQGLDENGDAGGIPITEHPTIRELWKRCTRIIPLRSRRLSMAAGPLKLA